VVNIPEQGLLLFYNHRGESVRELVHWTSTSPHYGGRAWYWRCPGCGRRCTILYCGPPFLCRACLGLTYVTAQSKRVTDSLDNRLYRLRERLGAPCGVGWPMDPSPPKPLRMHRETYDRLCWDYDRLMNLRFAAYDLELENRAGPSSAATPASRAAHAEQKRQLLREARRHVSLWDNLAALPLRWPEPDPPAPPPAPCGPVRLTLGQLAHRARVPLDFAKQAEAEGLMRADAGRGTKRKRYRSKLSSWLAKLYTLRGAGLSWGELRSWAARRFQPGHEHERRWPAGYEPGTGQRAECL
jgi:hypothetical protein